MSIKPWRESIKPITTLGEQLVPMQDEIDELRSMLAERDDEICLLNGTLESRNRNIEALHEMITAQHKVLDQAFYVREQVNQWFDWFHGDDKTLDAPLSTDVAGAIKEISK